MLPRYIYYIILLFEISDKPHRFSCQLWLMKKSLQAEVLKNLDSASLHKASTSCV